MTPTPAPTTPEMGWQSWQGAEREDFFAAVERHRRTTWRITAVCLLAYTVLALVMSVLLAPLLYCIAGLLLDVINVVMPMPDLLAYAGGLLSPLMDDPLAQAPASLLWFIFLAATPGLLLMLLVGWRVTQAICQTALFDPKHSNGRLPNPQIHAEQQFANTLAEMAIAALIPTPAIHIIPGGANVAAAGLNNGDATVVVGEALLPLLNRAQMQGLAAHLIATIANHDMKIGLHTASILGVFSLIARLTVNMQDKSSRAQSRQLLKALLLPTANNQALLVASLNDPFSDATQPTPPASDGRLGWQEWLSMPLMGPVWFSGFLGGLTNALLLAPLVSAAWRQRKYMADATAVRLTRQPDGLASALTVLQTADTTLLSAAWANHLCVLEPSTMAKYTQIVPIFPAPARRLTALVRMGASAAYQPAPPSQMPLWAKTVIGLLGSIAAGLLLLLLPLLAMASTMLTGLFTLLPTALLHALLR